MMIFAHRGYRAKYPENTLLSFRKAIEASCDGIELDVQRTADGELVIIHDETVDRTTDGTGYVKDMTLAELRRLDAGNGERIPTLAEYFELVKLSPLITNIELKNSVLPYEGMEAEALRMVRRYGLENRVIFSSFKHDSVILCKKLAPDIHGGLLCIHTELLPGHWERVFARMEQNGIEYLHPGTYSLTLILLEECIRRGVKINVWTVNDPGVLRRLDLEPCVNAAITDNPALEY